MTPAAPEWWKDFYDDLLADLLLEGTSEAEIEGTVVFLERVLHLRPGERVFDQCCGSGRLAVALARRGYAVTGVDLATGYIARARQKAQAENLAVEFTAGDAFTYTAQPSCSAVFNWWTSFGYSPHDAQNLEMLRRAWDSLCPGGWFALDYMNVPGLYRHFRPRVVTPGQSGGVPVTLIRDSTLEPSLGTMRKRWLYQLPAGRQVEHETRVRLYDPATLRRLFAEAGFRQVTIYGDTDGQELTLESPRCIVLGQRP